MKPLSANYFPQWNKSVRRMIITDIEFCLRTARAVLPTASDKAVRFVQHCLQSTADPRLVPRLRTILAMLKRGQHDAAARRLDEAIAYDAERRKGRPNLTQ